MSDRTTAETLALVEGLAQIAARHRLDRISVAGVEIARTAHVSPEDVARAHAALQRAGADPKPDSEDDPLYDAVGGPPDLGALT